MKNFPVRRVLVPVDLTSASARAWSWAGVLSAPDAKRTALFVRATLPGPVMGMPMPPLSRAARAALAARLRSTYKGCSAAVEEGDAATTISRFSRRADLIVMGSHGRTGLDRAVLGSVSEAVARDADAPVLAVRGAPRRIKSVLAPVNLTPYSRKGLALAAEAAAFFGAELAVLAVSPDRLRGANPRPFVAEALQKLPAGLRDGLKVRVIRRSGDPLREILAEARRHGLVVLTAHRKSLLSDLVLGTTAERVLRHCPVPVLTAPSGR